MGVLPWNSTGQSGVIPRLSLVTIDWWQFALGRRDDLDTLRTTYLVKVLDDLYFHFKFPLNLFIVLRAVSTLVLHLLMFLSEVFLYQIVGCPPVVLQLKAAFGSLMPRSWPFHNDGLVSVGQGSHYKFVDLILIERWFVTLDLSFALFDFWLSCCVLDAEAILSGQCGVHCLLSCCAAHECIWIRKVRHLI